MELNLPQILVNGLQASLIYVLIALGLTIVFSILDIVNFAHGEFYMLGAYAAFYLFGKYHVPYFLTLLLTVVIFGFLGFVFERILFRPIRGQGTLGLTCSLGLFITLNNTALLLFGPLDQKVPSVIPGTLSISSASISKERVMVAVVAAILILVLFYLIHRAKIGKAMRAVAQNRIASVLQGISVDKISGIGFGLGCALAAIGGALHAPLIFVNPSMGMAPAITAFVIIIIGGMGSISGAVAGGFVLGFLHAIAQNFVSGSWVEIMSFSLLIVVLIFKPKGLFGHA